MNQRSHGAQLLARTGLSLDEIREQLRAHKLTVSRQAVQQWCAGVTKPKPAARRLLKKLFSIDVAAWEEDPPAVPPTPTETLPTTDAPTMNIYGIAGLLESMVQADVVRLQADNRATPLERAKLRDTCASTLEKLAKLQDHFALKLLYHPAWQKIRQTLVNAVRPFGPEVLKAVEDAFVVIHEEIGKQE